jgi:hypothetical protein
MTENVAETGEITDVIVCNLMRAQTPMTRSRFTARVAEAKTYYDGRGPSVGLGRFSMTGGQVNDILETVKRHALSRFTSTYTVWFVPSLSASPRKHKLEVRLVEIKCQGD